jgi:hypothetical protein
MLNTRPQSSQKNQITLLWGFAVASRVISLLVQFGQFADWVLKPASSGVACEMSWPARRNGRVGVYLVRASAG